MQILHMSTGIQFRLYRSDFTHEMLIDYIIWGKKMDKTAIQGIFSKKELFQSNFHVSEEEIEDKRKVEVMKGNEPNSGGLSTKK
jgi:hypothetical protein